jgi:hypothetical protein
VETTFFATFSEQIQDPWETDDHALAALKNFEGRPMHDLCDAAEMDDPMAGHVPNVIAGARGRFHRMLEAVQALAPLITAERSEFDGGRRLPEAVFGALATAGLFRLWLPSALGGPELSPFEFMRVVEAASALDGSVGWLVGNGGGMSRLGGYLGEVVAREWLPTRAPSSPVRPVQSAPRPPSRAATVFPDIGRSVAAPIMRRASWCWRASDRRIRVRLFSAAISVGPM